MAVNILSIATVVKNKLCLSCGVCVSVCAQSAISLKGDIDQYPTVNANCTQCGACTKVCPGLHPLVHEQETPLGPVTNCYAGHAADATIRKAASSGGIVSALAIYLLESGAYDGVICVRQTPANALSNQTAVATSREEVLAAQGSRYAPTFVCKDLKDLAWKTKKYAIVGKPCDIQAAIKYARFKKLPQLLSIAIFCARTPLMQATKELLEKNGIDPAEVSSIQYRGNGWPGNFIVRSKDNKQLLKLAYMDAWSQYLCKQQYHKKRCYLCHDCTGEFADIAVGDAWLDKFTKSNSDGHSLIITRTDHAETIIKKCLEQNILILNDSSEQDVKQAQQSLLNNKNNIFFKRLVAKLLGQKLPQEPVTYSAKSNRLKSVPRIIKFFLTHKA